METQPVRHVLRPRRATARWASMPPISAAARRAALSALPDVRALMAGTRTSIACIQIELASRRKGRVVLWQRETGDVYRARAADRTVGAQLTEDIRTGLMPAAREIAARWPDTARPSIIGFATDGHLISFNPGHPACDGLEWLDAHLAATSPGAIVVDDGAEGLIAMLTSNRGMQ